MAENLTTVIGKDCTFTGTVEVKGALRVDGRVKGKIISDETVQVGATGEVEADITAKSVTAAGSVAGTVITTVKFARQARGKGIGEVKTRGIVIEQGAIFHGSCQMDGLKPTVEKADKMVEKKNHV